jgi:hypothetical protein
MRSASVARSRGLARPRRVQVPRTILLSSRNHTCDEDRLTVARLATHVAKAKSIFLAAAFYDIPYCEGLLSQADAGGQSVRLLFNGLGGARLLAQRDELTSLAMRLRKRFRSAEVRLAFAPGIFHTKLLWLRNTRDQRAFVGSANATMAAMTVNEEILLEVPGEGAVEGYAERVWASATPITELEGRLTARSLVAFFRTGSLYFKPTTSLQTTLNPFTDLLASLSDEERRKLGAASLPHSDQEAGVGAFNLRRAVGFSDAGKDAEDRENTKASIKPYSIETCFGYWVPHAVDHELQTTLQKVGASKRGRLLELLAMIESTGTKVLAARYDEYLAAVRELLFESGVSFSQYIEPPRRDPFDPKALTMLRERIVQSLRDDGYLDRLCSPFVRGAMPELWDDPLAYADFEASFFEHLEYVSQRPGRKSRVPTKILNRVRRRDGALQPSEIKVSLGKVLESKGWAEDDW